MLKKDLEASSFGKYSRLRISHGQMQVLCRWNSSSQLPYRVRHVTSKLVLQEHLMPRSEEYRILLWIRADESAPA